MIDDYMYNQKKKNVAAKENAFLRRTDRVSSPVNEELLKRGIDRYHLDIQR
jgi:hypothetical protein